jgi:hypothetical protein
MFFSMKKAQNLSVQGLVKHQPPDFLDSPDSGILRGDIDDVKHITSKPINAPTARTRHPAESGGVPGTSRKYYLTAVKESPEIAKLRPASMKDKTMVVNTDVYPKVVDDLDQRLHRK